MIAGVPPGMGNRRHNPWEVHTHQYSHASLADPPLLWNIPYGLYPLLPNIALPMGSYFRGDVLLAPLCISRGRGVKVRPVVVLGSSGRSGLFVIAVSSTLPYDGPVVPISIDDFSEGGLDLVAESYLVCTHICRIRVSDVIGKKGRLTGEMIQYLPIPEKGDTIP